MSVENAKVEYDGEKLAVSLPLTQPTGKVRVKARNFFGEYGNPVATRQTPLSQNCYVEWQIGYDVPSREAYFKTSLPEKLFMNSKREMKAPYELSEIIFYAYKLKFIKRAELKEVYDFVESVPDDKLLDVIDSMRILRTNPVETRINGIDFYEMKVSYPLVVHKFDKYDIYVEIMNREKQKGVGVQPMLYVCIPITELKFAKEPLGRILATRESAEWQIGEDEAHLALEMFKLFGMLSERHRQDVLKIFETLFKISSDHPQQSTPTFTDLLSLLQD